MTAFNQALNTDVNNKLTSAVYDTDLVAWIQKSQIHVLNASGILVPLALDVNSRLQISVKDSALPEGAASAAKQDALAALVATAANQATMQNLIGALNSAAIIDPTAGAAVIQLLKGLLKQLQGTGTAGTSAPFQVTGRKMTENTHHNAATAAADGIDIDVTGLSDLGLLLKGTSTSRTWKFYISINGTVFTPVKGYNFETGGMASFSNGGNDTAPESWSFPVAGAKKFRCRLDAVAGGNATAISEVVA